jgi:hypothetical protein
LEGAEDNIAEMACDRGLRVMRDVAEWNRAGRFNVLREAPQSGPENQADERPGLTPSSHRLGSFSHCLGQRRRLLSHLVVVRGPL